MRIIPAIHVFEGKCLPLLKDINSTKKVYSENPIELAKEFEGAGMQYLHLVDLDGTKANHIINYKVLEQITSKTNLKIDFKGGLTSDEDIHIAFNSGAKQIVGTSIAKNHPDVFNSWLNKYGSTKIILGTDYNSKHNDINIIPFIKSYENKGIKYVICSDLAKDVIYEEEDSSIDLYKHILNESGSIKLIASGNVVTLNDLNTLEDLGCEGVIIGNALYEGSLRLRDLETYS